MSVNSEFEKIVNEPKLKFSVVLGSGFHRQALGRNSILSNWEKLLKDQDPELTLTGFYPLDYEQLIVRRSSFEEERSPKSKTAGEIEKRISDEVCHDLKSAQEKALKFNKQCYPTSIFNPEKVTDIISLNFDTTAEMLCCGVAGVQNAIQQYAQFESTKSGNFNLPYWEVKFKNSGSIRFWYPHGSVHEKDSITLGTREYSKRLSMVEGFRKHSKSTIKALSWYHQLTHQPVLILGADMQKDEWDLWFAFVNRERNFAKSENKVYKHPVFQMRACECNPDYRHKWFLPLFTGIKFKEQWRELEKYLKTE